jgi:hypothetical protein
MAALSDYLESGLLNHVFRNENFPKPSSIAIALTSGVIKDSDTGVTIPEIASGINGSGTGYARILLDRTDVSGNDHWSFSNSDFSVGSGLIKNAANRVFNTALLDWGWISGMAITDHGGYGSGNLLMHSTLDNPRIIYTGDSPAFDAETLQISFK